MPMGNACSGTSRYATSITQTLAFTQMCLQMWDSVSRSPRPQPICESIDVLVIYITMMHILTSAVKVHMHWPRPWRGRLVHSHGNQVTIVGRDFSIVNARAIGSGPCTIRVQH